MELEPNGYDFDAPGSDWNHEPSLAAVFGHVTAALYATDADGWLTYYNDAAADLWGRRPVLGEARWCGSWRLYRPDGTLLAHADCAMALALRSGRPVHGQSAVLARPDGVRLTITPHSTPVRDRAGLLVAGASIVLEHSGAARSGRGARHSAERFETWNRAPAPRPSTAQASSRAE